MRAEYKQGVMILHADTMRDAAELVGLSGEAGRDGFKLEILFTPAGDRVFLEIPLRQRAPAEKRQRGDKAGNSTSAGTAADKPPATEGVKYDPAAFPDGQPAPATEEQP